MWLWNRGFRYKEKIARLQCYKNLHKCCICIIFEPFLLTPKARGGADRPLPSPSRSSSSLPRRLTRHPARTAGELGFALSRPFWKNNKEDMKVYSGILGVPFARKTVHSPLWVCPDHDTALIFASGSSFCDLRWLPYRHFLSHCCPAHALPLNQFHRQCLP